MDKQNNVTVQVVGGPTVYVPWVSGMNAQQALEGAYNQINNSGKFTYAVQYYGNSLGYLVMMINETYDSFISSAAPFYYWEFLVNGIASPQGIDSVVLNAGDVVGFSFEGYSSEKHANSTLAGKHAFQAQASK